MRSQWECLLQNLGEWHGSFTQLSPAGEPQDDTPTIVALAGLNQNQTIRQTIRRLTTPVNETVLEYSSLGRGVLFLETGAFSQGSIQFAPFADFGAELGLIETGAEHQPGDRRLRLVQLFNRDGQLAGLTLIREHRAHTTPPPRSPLTVTDLLGTWQGKATTVFPDWRTAPPVTTTLQICQDNPTQISQTLKFGDAPLIHSTAAIAGNRLLFNQGKQPVQVLLLPDGASSTGPTTIQRGQPFFLEVGWLLQPHLRQRLIRQYSDRGEWLSLTLVTEHKVTDHQPNAE